LILLGCGGRGRPCLRKAAAFLSCVQASWPCFCKIQVETCSYSYFHSQRKNAVFANALVHSTQSFHLNLDFNFICSSKSQSIAFAAQRSNEVWQRYVLLNPNCGFCAFKIELRSAIETSICSKAGLKTVEKVRILSLIPLIIGYWDVSFIKSDLM